VSEPFFAIVSITLDASEDRAYRLPGAGTRSLLYVFDGQQIGARAETMDGQDLVPGTTHSGVRLTFWAPEAPDIIHEGSGFDVWYGGTVGHGSVESLS
jgi:hypothetical protein